MQNSTGPFHSSADGLQIADIATLDLDTLTMTALEPMRILAHALATKIVKHEDPLAARGQCICEIAPEEAAAAGDQDRPAGGHAVETRSGHATSPLRASSAAACSTRSSATCRDSHSASSANPMRKSVCGAKPRTLRLRVRSAK